MSCGTCVYTVFLHNIAGLFIETSTIITLLLSVGLAVDYAAHIAHKFLILSGTRNMRMRVTLGQIGAAVFNGGFSTFLALVLLAGSDTYSYKVFFTVSSILYKFTYVDYYSSPAYKYGCRVGN